MTELPPSPDRDDDPDPRLRLRILCGDSAMLGPGKAELLDRIAELIDTGKIRTTLGEVMTPINAETLKEAHRKSEAGRAKGKIVLEGF